MLDSMGFSALLHGGYAMSLRQKARQAEGMEAEASVMQNLVVARLSAWRKAREEAFLADQTAAAANSGEPICSGWLPLQDACLDPSGEPAVELQFCQLSSTLDDVTMQTRLRTTPAGIDAKAYGSLWILGEGFTQALMKPEALNRAEYLGAPVRFERSCTHVGCRPIWDVAARSFHARPDGDSRAVWDHVVHVRCGL